MEPQYDIRQLQLASIGLLDTLDRVCREHGLTYYMIAGTLLGAVRHKGFIPWDDDIDVGMPREDYDTLLEHASQWFDYPYSILSHSADSGYSRYFAKLEDCSTTLVERFYLKRIGGLYLDIFPLDDAPSGKLAWALHYRRFRSLDKRLYFAYRDPYKHGRGIGSCLISLAQGIMSKERLHARTAKAATGYNGRGLDMCTTHDNAFELFPKSVLGTPVEYEFEGRRFFGPSDADTFLKIMYGGDYMAPPPASIRVPHYYEYVDFNTPYAGADFDVLKKKAGRS